MDLRDYLIVGSYLFGAGAYVLLYRAIGQLQASIDRFRVDLSYTQGKVSGQDHEERLIRLERLEGKAAGQDLDERVIGLERRERRERQNRR